MILLPSTMLSHPIASQLKKWQQAIDDLPEYKDRVGEAKRAFARRNRNGDPTFDSVKRVLVQMCSGAGRCGYCEDSMADEVEHIKPKDLYPEETFLWENYLYACGPCNGPKNNRFAIFSEATGGVVDVTRRPRDPVLPPEPGVPLLINPRLEDPLAFIELDLLGTFFFRPRLNLSENDRNRADYTIEVLRLNDRDLLLKAREEAFEAYHARLVAYVRAKGRGASDTELQHMRRSISNASHPTVWREMQRQHPLIPALHTLFYEAPEACDW